jgi:hypothetical protein
VVSQTRVAPEQSRDARQAPGEGAQAFIWQTKPPPQSTSESQSTQKPRRMLHT